MEIFLNRTNEQVIEKNNTENNNRPESKEENKGFWKRLFG